MKTIENKKVNLCHTGHNFSIPNVITTPLYATVRIKKGTHQILDGRTYKTEKGMRSFRASRPASAVCIKIVMRLPNGMIDCEII